jgi:hypothetical protein
MMDNDQLTEDERQIYAAVHASPACAPTDSLSLQLQSLRMDLCRAPSAQARWNHLAAMRRARQPVAARRGVRGVAAIAAATVGLVAVTTGLAAADRLPGPAQDQVAKLAEIVGLDLPGNNRPADPPRAPTDTDRPTEGLGSLARNPAVLEQAAAIPGAGVTAPASSEAAPSRSDSTSDTPPDSSATAPGRTGTTPGQTGTTPGQTGTTPGSSGTAPGHTGTGPGGSATAPGTTGAAPGLIAAPGPSGIAPESAAGAGRSDYAPGHTESTPDSCATAPGHSQADPVSAIA